jgi:hypothetical protein
MYWIMSWKNLFFFNVLNRQQNDINFKLKKKLTIKKNKLLTVTFLLNKFIYKNSSMHPDLARHQSSVDCFPIYNFHK